MKSYAVSIWLCSTLGHRPKMHSGEFSEAEIEAWEVASRQARRSAWIAAIRRWLADRPGVAKGTAKGVGVGG